MWLLSLPLGWTLRLEWMLLYKPCLSLGCDGSLRCRCQLPLIPNSVHSRVGRRCSILRDWLSRVLCGMCRCRRVHSLSVSGRCRRICIVLRTCCRPSLLLRGLNTFLLLQNALNPFVSVRIELELLFLSHRILSVFFVLQWLSRVDPVLDHFFHAGHFAFAALHRKNRSRILFLHFLYPSLDIGG